MPATKPDFTATEIKAGVLVLVSLIILVGFVATIRGCRPRDEDAKRFHTTFADIGGLNEGADVRFGGVKVGRVVEIAPDPEDRSQIRITAVVRGGVPVNSASVATIGQVTLTTEKHLEISTGDAAAPLLEDGTTLTSRAGGGFMDIPDLGGVTARLELLLDGAVELLGVEKAHRQADGGEPELVDLARLFESLDETLGESTSTVRQLNEVIGDNRAGFQQVVADLVALEGSATQLLDQLNAVAEENRPPLRETMVNLERLTADTNQRVEDLMGSLQATARHLEDSGANVSDLFEEYRPSIEEILINLQRTTRNLSEFSRTLAEQPQAIVRGKKLQGRSTGESP